MRYTPNGQSVTSFSIASNHSYTKASGEKAQEVEWFKATAFGRLGEVANQYLDKGSKVYLEGRLKSSSYEARDGTTRFSNEITVTELQMLGKAQGGGRDAAGEPDDVEDADSLPF